jgi:hypothetical protein
LPDFETSLHGCQLLAAVEEQRIQAAVDMSAILAASLVAAVEELH